MILSLLLSTAHAQNITWEAPEGAHEKYTVGGYRLSYEIFHPEEECVPVETKYFLDLGEVYSYKLHEDINFRPGYHYYIALDTYTKKGEVSKPTKKGACVTVRPQPEPVSHVGQNDDYSLVDNVDGSGVYGFNKTTNERISDNEEDIYFPSSDVPSPISDGGTSKTDVDSSVAEHTTGTSGDYWISGVLGRGGSDTIKLDRYRNAIGEHGDRREDVSVQSETSDVGLVAGRGVLLRDDVLHNGGRDSIGVGKITASLQNNGNSAPFPPRESDGGVKLILVLLGILLIVFAVGNFAQKKKA